MNYKTRGNSSPYGKAKVYFSCHPEDFTLYFDDIANLILKNSNCSIWFENSYGVKPDCAKLNSMQLIVIPVTSNYLFSENYSRDSILEYALRNHIPVLPLVQEDGIELEFNFVCGDVQCISRFSKGVFQEDYEKRISSYLSRILIGDDMIEKIRKEFEACVFISYRKTDRQYAKELIHLIHSNDFCRDIAVWYDEFLIPGEHFNSAIEKAIKRCELFAMVVTPNIVENDNYVMKKEFPMAKKEGKSIVPVEMRSTDKATFSQIFEGVSEPIDAADKNSLAQILLSSLKNVILEKRINEPQHLFFIGIAYLKGIDVEVDYKKGIELIEKAAEGGMQIAMHKLAVLFSEGECVERNYNQSITWYEKLIEGIDNNWDDNTDSTDLVQILWELASVYNKNKDYLNSKRIYKRLLNTCESAKLIDERIRVQYKIIALNCLGSMAYAEKKFGRAIEYYDMALFFCTEAEIKSLLECDYFRSVSYANIGIIREEYNGNIEKALEYYRACLKIRKRLVAKDRMIKTIKDLSLCYRNMAFAFRTLQRKNDELICWKKVFTLEQEIFELVKGEHEKKQSINTLQGIENTIAKLK